MSRPEELEKDQAPQPNQPRAHFSELSLFQLSTILYALLGTIGGLIAFYGHDSLGQAFAIPAQSAALRLLMIAGLGAGVLLIASWLFEDFFPSYQQIKESVTTILGPTSVPMAIYLSFISAGGEELLFRVAILPYAGLFISSALFGLLHLGPDGKVSAWSFWAVLAGLMLGWMYQSTGSIWPPLLTHATVNTVSILRLQRAFRQKVKLLESRAAEKPATDDAAS